MVKLQQERAGRAAQIDKPPEAVDVRSNSSNDDIAKRENDRIKSDRIRAEEINRQDRQQDRKNEQKRSRGDEENER